MVGKYIRHNKIIKTRKKRLFIFQFPDLKQ